MKNMTCAIHQPNFFPWLGYFDKIHKADILVFLDHVQFSKQTWTTRVSVDDHGEAKWLSCPVTAKFGDKISEVRLKSFPELRDYVEGRFKSIYRHAPYFEDIFTFLQKSFAVEETHLGSFNEKIIRTIVEKLELTTPLVLQSSLGLDDTLRANQLLVGICQKVGAQAYLCGGGASGYQEDQVFKNENLRVIYQEYREPHYRDSSLRGLSVLDSLAHLGWAGTSQLIRRS